MTHGYHKPPPVGFIAYIDESGDDGLSKVSPIDPQGATEWFSLSAVVIRLPREGEVLGWVRRVLASLDQHQRRDIHFRTLALGKKAVVCNALAKLPLRCFVVLSNKKNMRRYRNERAETIPSKNWFYNWMNRLLLERVTDFCERRSISEYGSPRAVRLEYSRRGGVSYSQMRAYLSWLRGQSEAGALFLQTGDLRWSVFDPHQVFYYDHRSRPGLQLSDVVASAFYQAVRTDDESLSDPQFAMMLRPRMCPSAAGRIFGYSVKLMPNIRQLTLSPTQQRLFDFYSR